MKTRLVCVALCFFPLVRATTAVADTIRVPADAPTIQIAIQKAQPFDLIIVAPGTYHEAIDLSGKVITVQSEDPNDPAVVASTIIDAGGLGTVVSFSGGADHIDTLLAGFTLRNGITGIEGHGSGARVHDCVITANSSNGVDDLDGELARSQVTDNGGIGIVNCDGVISQCTISGNWRGIQTSDATIIDTQVTDSLDHGLIECDGELIRCIVSRNKNSGLWACDISIHQSVISGNITFGCLGCNGDVIDNSVFVGNGGNGLTSSSADVLSCTIAANGGWGFADHTGEISHAIIWSNEGGALLRSTTPVSSGTFNPFFVLPGFLDNSSGLWVDGNYNLTPDSAYIDIGDPFYGDDPSHPTVDLAGNPRIVGARADIVAYEFQAECVGPDFDDDGTPDLCDSDIDNDGVTNVPDQCDFTPAGIEVDGEGRPHADMNRDCIVDLRDYARLQNSMFGPGR